MVCVLRLRVNEVALLVFLYPRLLSSSSANARVVGSGFNIGDVALLVCDTGAPNLMPVDGAIGAPNLMPVDGAAGSSVVGAPNLTPEADGVSVG